MKPEQKTPKQAETFLPDITMPELPKPCSPSWAMLIKHVYEADPLKCPNCGEPMKVVGLIEHDQVEVIEKILKHCGLWIIPTPRPPPQPEIRETVYVPCEDYQPFESLYA